MVIKIMQYFLHSEIPANIHPTGFGISIPGLSTDLLLRFSWPIILGECRALRGEHELHV